MNVDLFDCRTKPEALAETYHRMKSDEQVDTTALGAIARNPNTPQEILKELAELALSNQRPRVLLCDLAANHNLPVEIALKIAESGGYCAVGALLDNPFTKSEVLERIVATWDEERFRREAAMHPNASYALVDSVLGDLGIAVSLLWREIPLTRARLNRLLFLHSDNNEELLRALAAHPQVAGRLLQRLVTDPRPKIREAAAYNPNLTSPQIEALSADPDFNVRNALHTNIARQLRERALLVLLE